jgi:hypothetical protein
MWYLLVFILLLILSLIYTELLIQFSNTFCSWKDKLANIFSSFYWIYVFFCIHGHFFFEFTKWYYQYQQTVCDTENYWSVWWPLSSPSDIISINKLTVTLKIIGQCDDLWVHQVILSVSTNWLWHWKLLVSVMTFEFTKWYYQYQQTDCDTENYWSVW